MSQEPRTYKFIELVGTSPESYEAAIGNAISQASKTLDSLSWYEVIEHRGRVVDGKVAEYQVTLKVAFLVKQ
jgi:flavin-binding protein dodecin